MIKIAGYLTGRILISLPDIKSQEFNESVIFICKHDENGAMGFVINQSLDGVSLSDLMQDEIGDSLLMRDPPIFWGGPIEINRGFVLHSLDCQFNNTISIDDKYGITANLDILRAIMNGENSPDQYTILLGYTGWKPGQLEKEMAQQSWIPLPAIPDLLFSVPFQKKWEIAIGQLGWDRISLSPTRGEA
jgi:putative transcriptional regulator